MSDFGAGACDFHSDFASDFRPESNDYASDFRDFPGDFSGDFGGAPRTAKQPPETPDRIAGAGHRRRQGHRGTRTAASWQRTAQPASHGAGDNDTPQGHKQGLQSKRDGGGIGIAPNMKTPYRCVIMTNKTHSRKAPGIHQKQRKTPHSVSHAGQGCYSWSFARSSSSRKGCNKIYSKIKGTTSFQNNTVCFRRQRSTPDLKNQLRKSRL